MHRFRVMRWTRRHPLLAWLGLVLVLAAIALFLRDIGTGP
jgi:Na+/melibiose symporter-like transporter